MINLVIMLICGTITALVASSKGRNAVGWFFVGFLLGIIGLIISFCMSDLKKQKAKEQQMMIQNRRLKEQMRQERLRTEALRNYATQRLDAHDEALQMDTSQASSILPSPGITQALPKPVSPVRDASPLDSLQQMASGDNSPQPVPVPVGHTPYIPKPDTERMWHYEHQGKEMGPVKERTVQMMLVDGQLSGESLVWSDHLDDWTPARQIKPFKTWA
jgi:hypothetical protein